MNLLLMLETHESRASEKFYDPSNRDLGLCTYCNEPIAEYGRNKTNCEYHWLKHKFNSINKSCRNANSSYDQKNYHLKGISCTMTWQEFIIWAHNNDGYKRLKDPALLRIDKTKNYEVSNIRWGEMSEIFNFNHRKTT